MRRLKTRWWRLDTKAIADRILHFPGGSVAQ